MTRGYRNIRHTNTFENRSSDNRPGDMPGRTTNQNSVLPQDVSDIHVCEKRVSMGRTGNMAGTKKSSTSRIATDIAAWGQDVRVATYTRRSTTEDNQPYSIEAQDARLASYIDSQPGWRHTTSFTDDASGASAERPGLQRAASRACRTHRCACGLPGRPFLPQPA